MATRRELLTAIDRAMSESKTVTIRIDGETGNATVKINRDIEFRWKDSYEAVDILFPELSEKHEAA